MLYFSWGSFIHMQLKKLACLLTFMAGALAAQRSETIPFRAVMLPSNEVPPVEVSASGAATLWVHLVRDAGGQIVSGSVDFDVSYTFPGEMTFTGLHIHRGAAGVNGPVTVDSGISGSNPVNDPAGRGTIKRQGQATSEAALETLRGMLENPQNYYVNLHSTTNQAGIIRGQLQRAQMVVLMGLMSPLNEDPPITSTNASGVASIIALATRDSAGTLTSGQVVFDVNYTGFSDDTRFTGMHIHEGPAGVNGPVRINTGISGNAPVAVATGGAGNLHYEVEVPMANANAVSTLNGLFTDPQNYYVNLHTTVFPGGVIRDQLRTTDRMHFPVTMLPSNEVPPIANLDARAEAAVTVHTLRNAQGGVVAGTVIFDLNPRFPGETTFTGMHIHNGEAGANGGVTIDSGVGAPDTLTSASGMANIYRVVNVTTEAGLATLNSLVMNPERHYVNLHTTVNRGGAVRAQLTEASTAAPRPTDVTSSVSDPNLRTVAPGGLMSILGSNLTKVPGSLGGFPGTSAPTSMNGVQVSIAGRNAPIVVLEKDVVVVQVPFETPAGSQPVTLTTPNGTSAAVQVTVANAAPAIFFDSVGGVIVKNSDFGLVRPGNPARAGDILVIYATGLGPVTGLSTGQVVPFTPFFSTSPVTVTIGGQNAEVIYSLASPGFLGLYQTAVRMPSSVAAGNAVVVLRVGDAVSNSVNLAVQ
jgi:uncharacterized protein (TIGR03437 family)